MNKMLIKLQNKKAEMYVSKVVWTLAVIIVGMLLMWGIYAIFSGSVLPRLENALQTIFDNADDKIDAGNATEFAPSHTPNT
jgi:hypothetical protein